jgi:hypothetical protein
MQGMKYRKRLLGSWMGAVLLLGTACNHEAGVEAAAPSFSGGQNLPFERVSDKGGLSPTASLVSAEIPRATPVTVRIESKVSSAHSQPGDSFWAILDVPIVVDGQSIAASGSSVAGKVIASAAASADNQFGSVRLTLTSLTVDGKILPIQTANIFVKAASPYSISSRGSGQQATPPGTTNDVEFPAERRLTFRLTQSLSTRP